MLANINAGEVRQHLVLTKLQFLSLSPGKLEQVLGGAACPVDWKPACYPLFCYAQPGRGMRKNGPPLGGPSLTNNFEH